MSKVDRTLRCRALEKCGLETQFGMAIEECSEFMVALQHYKRGRCTKLDVATEIADVENMMQQMRIYFGDDLVDAEHLKKKARLEERLDHDD